MRPNDRTEYIVACIREAGSMYPEDAARFLAEHDARVTRAALESASRQMYEGVAVGSLTPATRGRVSAWLSRLATLREAAIRTGTAVPAAGQDDTSTTSYFQPGHTYTRPSHGRQVEFLVTQVSTAPDRSQRRAFGWHRVEGYSTWSNYSNDDYATWTETAPTPADTYADTRGEPGDVTP